MSEKSLKNMGQLERNQGAVCTSEDTRTQLLCPANFRVFLNQVNVKPIPDI